MVRYNYAVEWGVLPIIIAIIISFRRDYDAKSIHFRYLKTMYWFALITSVITLITSLYNKPLASMAQVVWGYIFNTLYFVLLPSTPFLYCVYTQFSSHSTFSDGYIKKKILPLAIPYIIYLAILIPSIINGNIFSVTQAEGYVRGAIYRLPFPLVGVYIIMIVAIIAKNFKLVSEDTVFVISTSMSLSMVVLIVLFFSDQVIATGLLSTTCILVLHLYVMNVRKTEDAMTGVQNRQAFLYKLDKRIAMNQKFSLYVFSVRGMKQVNEQFGLGVGDKLLSYVADILQHHVSRGKIFRYSGDEFVLILPYVEENKSPYMEQLEEAFKGYAEVEGHQIPMGVVAVRVDFPSFGNQTQDLISAVDYGINQLKNKNKSGVRYLYDINVTDEMRSQHTMIRTLNRAIRDYRFVVHYQPIHHVESGEVAQAEALVRMLRQDGSIVFPNEFIGIAESTGLITEMTYQMLNQVCKDFRAILNTQENTTLKAISINVPYVQFTRADMEERFMEILDKHRIKPSQIKIEVTERIVVTDFDMMIEKMNSMMQKGFEFELDDFGIDYSNLKMCLNLPTAIIKLDRSLLLSAMASEGDMIFFKHIIAGINSKGRKIILEGVETNEQLAWAKECRCDYIQGYYYSRPIDFEGFKNYLRIKARSK